MGAGKSGALIVALGDWGQDKKVQKRGESLMSRNRSEKQYHKSFGPVGAGARVIQAAAVLFGAVVMFLAGVAAVHAKGNGQGVAIRVVSSRPEVASGGSALVQVSLPQHAAATDIKLILNGKDVTINYGAPSMPDGDTANRHEAAHQVKEMGWVRPSRADMRSGLPARGRVPRSSKRCG